jgi:hypothetical protein
MFVTGKDNSFCYASSRVFSSSRWPGWAKSKRPRLAVITHKDSASINSKIKHIDRDYVMSSSVYVTHPINYSWTFPFHSAGRIASTPKFPSDQWKYKNWGRWSVKKKSIGDNRMNINGRCLDYFVDSVFKRKTHHTRCTKTEIWTLCVVEQSWNNCGLV